MYAKGDGVAKDHEKAVYYFRKAANQGDADAQSNLGFMYANGDRVAKDYEEAIYWYRKAAEQGNASAQHNLGVMYHNGHGVARDYRKAVYWYRKAAEQGNATAKEALARLEEKARKAEEARKDQEAPDTYTDPHTGMDFIKVQGGTFTMGGKPKHQVTLTKDYYIGKYPVTQAQWRKVMGDNPSEFENCDNCPVERVSWDDIQEFLVKLNRQTSTKGTGKRYRLPTEAEWEYAARGGAKSKSYKYAGSDDIDEVAWYDGNSGLKTHPVGQKYPNELGLYDMTGNVWEWCADWYSHYSSGAKTDPKGPSARGSAGCRIVSTTPLAAGTAAAASAFASVYSLELCHRHSDLGAHSSSCNQLGE